MSPLIFKPLAIYAFVSGKFVFWLKPLWREEKNYVCIYIYQKRLIKSASCDLSAWDGRYRRVKIIQSRVTESISGAVRYMPGTTQVYPNPLDGTLLNFSIYTGFRFLCPPKWSPPPSMQWISLSVPTIEVERISYLPIQYIFVHFNILCLSGVFS